MDNQDPYQIDKQQARRAFERAAATYDEAAVLQDEVGMRLLERLDLVRLQPDSILDLGAGTGKMTAGLMKRYRKARVVAVDIAHSMLQRTRRRGGWLRRPRCICADAEQLPFAGNSFDLIFSNLMIQWCQPQDTLFGEFHRVLRPGGLLMFTTFGPDTLQELRECWARADDCVHVNTFADMHDIGDALLQARLADPVVDAERITMTYADARRLMMDLKHIGAHNVTRGRPQGLTGRQRLRRVIEAYENYRQEGVLPASYEVVYGHAWAPQSGRSSTMEMPVSELLCRKQP